MNVNVGGIDRTLRIVAGLAVLSLFFVLEGNARYWALVGFVPLFTERERAGERVRVLTRTRPTPSAPARRYPSRPTGEPLRARP